MPGPLPRYDYAASRNRRLPPEVYAEPGQAVLLTLRAYRGRPFAANPALCAEIVRLLKEMAPEYGCTLGAYCLMPDHLHLVAAPAEEGRSVLTFLARFSGKSTNASWRCGWSGKLWQPRGHDHVIRQAEGVDTVIEYVLENPARAGLVEDAADWPWSGVAAAE